MTTSRSRFRVRFSISVERVQASYVSQQPCKRYSTGQRWLSVVWNLAGRSIRTFTSRPTAGESIVRSHMRPLTCSSLATIRGGCAGGVAEAGSSGSRVGASVAAQPASRVKIRSAIASHQGRRAVGDHSTHYVGFDIPLKSDCLTGLLGLAAVKAKPRLDLFAPVFEANLAELEGCRRQGRVDHTRSGDLRIDQVEARRRLAVAEETLAGAHTDRETSNRSSSMSPAS